MLQRKVTWNIQVYMVFFSLIYNNSGHFLPRLFNHHHGDSQTDNVLRLDSDAGNQCIEHSNGWGIIFRGLRV